VFGRGNALCVLVAVIVAQDAQVDVAALDFREVNLIGALIAGGEFLKQEDLGDEPPQERITQQKRLQIAAERREFLLHAADEDSEAGGRHGHYFAGAVIPAIIWLNSLSILAAKSASIW